MTEVIKQENVCQRFDHKEIAIVLLLLLLSRL